MKTWIGRTILIAGAAIACASQLELARSVYEAHANHAPIPEGRTLAMMAIGIAGAAIAAYGGSRGRVPPTPEATERETDAAWLRLESQAAIVAKGLAPVAAKSLAAFGALAAVMALGAHLIPQAQSSPAFLWLLLGATVPCCAYVTREIRKGTERIGRALAERGR